MTILEKKEINTINRHFPNIELNNEFSEGKNIEIYKNFLAVNLTDNIERICNLEDDGFIQSIDNITFPFRDLNISFSIELLNQNYKGKYTIWCPELLGCITQGKSKQDAFDNLLWAISEVMVINYDNLKCNPLIKPISPLPINSQINFPNTLFGHNILSFTRYLHEVNVFKNIYVGKKHVIFKSKKNPLLNITFPVKGINDLTKFCIDNILNE